MKLGPAALAAAITLASVSTTGVALASTAMLPACTTSGLTVSRGHAGVAAGSTYYPLRFRNASEAACTLAGYPGVSWRRDGKQVGRAASRDTTAAPSPVLLLPGQTAHSTLQVAEAGNYPPEECKPVTVYRMRVRLPGQSSSVTLRLKAQVCSAKMPTDLGSPLSVTALSGSSNGAGCRPW